MEYDIQEHPLILFLGELYRQGLSGELAVEGANFHKNMVFSAGKLSYAASDRFDERIMTIMRLMGKLSEEQYLRVSGLLQQHDDQIGGVLIDFGYFSADDLYYARLYQFRRIALSVFSLQQGRWSFRPTVAPPPQGEAFAIPLADIIVEGARRTESASFMAARHLFHVPRPAPLPPDLLSLFTEEERLFFQELVQAGGRSCRELIARLSMQPLLFWRRVIAMHLLGLLDFTVIPVDEDYAADVCELLRVHERIRAGEGDDFSLLGVAADATLSRLADAYARLQQRFAPERFGSAAAPEIKRIAAEVSHSLQDVFLRLTDRCRLAMRIQPPVPPSVVPPAVTLEPSPPPPVPVDFLELTPPPMVAVESGGISPAPSLPVEDDAEIPMSPPLPFFEPLPEVVEESPQVTAEWAFSIVSQPTAPGGLAENEGEKPTPAAVSEPDAPQEVKPPLSPAADPDSVYSRAREVYLQGVEIYEQGKFLDAAMVFRQAVKLDPSQGDFYYMLGLCQSELEYEWDDAEANLKKAITMLPWSADAVYALGSLFRRQGKIKVAEACFQRVKDITMEHSLAGRAIAEMRRGKKPAKTPLSFLKKKVF